jgi:serine/threonine protein kinase
MCLLAENILIDKRTMTSYLIDFGHVKEDLDEVDSGPFGTEGYNEHANSSPNSDIFALGLTLIEFVLKRRIDPQDVQFNFDNILLSVKDVDVSFHHFVMRFFDRDRNAKSAAELLEDDWFQVDYSLEQNNLWFCYCLRRMDFDEDIVTCCICKGPMHLVCSGLPPSQKDSKEFICSRFEECRQQAEKQNESVRRTEERRMEGKEDILDGGDEKL